MSHMNRVMTKLLFHLGGVVSAMLAMAALLSGCEEQKEEKWVDLRYRVEDSYTVAARNAEEVSFLVKSTDPWVVEGNADWYDVNPAEGGPDEIYTVTVRCQDNDDLDDRRDTLSIRSDYWVGKRFEIVQKGIAYLNADEGDSVIEKTGGTLTFNIRSNQKWSAEVSSGESWLSIVHGFTGEDDGQVTVSALTNKGELREGVVTVYDRHGEPALLLLCSQDGITLSPAIPENGKWFALQPETQTLEIPVDADVEWTAEKADPDDDWYEISEMTTSDRLVLNVSEHTGKAVREAEIIIASVAAEGAEQVFKTVKFKQINPYYAETVYLNQTIAPGAPYNAEGMSYGKYLFYVNAGMTSTDLFFQIQWKWGTGSADYCNVQYRIQNKVAKGMTSPWNTHINYSGAGAALDYYRTVDTSRGNVLGFLIEENTDVSPSIGNFCWYLNGEEVADMKKIGAAFNPATMFWDRISTPDGVLSITSNSGSAVIEKYDYYPPLDWGE